MTRRGERYLSQADLLAFVPNSDLYDLDEVPYLWNVDSVLISERTNISGWCLPHGGRVDNTQIVVNGRSFDPTRSSPKGLFAELYPWHPNSALASFTLEIPHETLDIRKLAEISMACWPKSGPPEARGYSLDLLVEDLKFKLPPADVGTRIGVTDLIPYVMFGRSIFRGFDKAIVKNFGKSFAEFSTIVDWGCGSGRVARHVAASLEKHSKLIGFDIDAAAVKWANINVGPYFKMCKAKPPLDQPTASVDLVYAYSVFTHLPADVLMIWVKEMARILKPGGVGLFTILSDRAMIALQCGLPRTALEVWNGCGIFDSMKNTDLNAIQSDDYYRNVWVKRHYIERVFKGLFEIVDFIGSFHFYQDLVVVRRL